MLRLVRSGRIRRFGLRLACFLFCVGQMQTPVSRAATVEIAPRAVTLSDSEIRRILMDRIDVQKQGVGIVIGIIEPHKRRVIAYGSLEKGDPRTLDGDTLFEIGSITKVFTALLAADMAQRNELRLDDPIAKYLPANVKVPERHGRPITLIDLATHTSGLPRMPENFHPKDPNNPYADYSVDALYSFLSSYELRRDIGIKYVYSNLGFGLLGLGLAQRAGVDYEHLVVRRICDPLGMSSTRITLSDALRGRFAAGHSSDLVTVPHWDLHTMPGAGALRSTANDLLTFLAAMMNYSKNPLAGAQKTALMITRPTDWPFWAAGLGWDIDTSGGSKIISKGGDTAGFSTFIGYRPETGVGVVVLANTEAPGTDQIGQHLLDARYPLWVPEDSPSNEPSIQAPTLDRYVGHYELIPTFVLTVTREADQLFVQATGQPRAAVYPKNDAEFYYKAVDAQITFEANGQIEAAALLLHQNGQDQRARRIDDATAKQLEETLAQRVKDQKPFPESEAMVRGQIDQLQRREPDFDELTPEFAEIARPRAEHIETLLGSLGALQSVTFKGVGPGGFDKYDVKFERGAIDWRILIDGNGKIASETLQSIP
jgi:D-alanyl-D-alanine-carboxypeptidase/D-alanyl-D-alanine-endopeptidase